MEMGCLEQTFHGLAGIGDLVVTATSVHSRNNKAGNLIGKGYTPEKAIKEAAGKICESVALFDVYKGEQIEAGKKSVAFNLTLRAADRTLNDEEINGAMEKVVKAVTDLGAVVR